MEKKIKLDNKRTAHLISSYKNGLLFSATGPKLGFYDDDDFNNFSKEKKKVYGERLSSSQSCKKADISNTLWDTQSDKKCLPSRLYLIAIEWGKTVDIQLIISIEEIR